MTSILSETFAPPITATNGRSVAKRHAEIRELFSISKAAARGEGFGWKVEK